MKIAELYDTDFAEWTRRNAELLRSGRAQEADLAHIAEEIEDMGKRERRALESRLVRLFEHLLKWQHQPERRGSSWQRTILQHRKSVARLLQENPSLHATLPEVVAEAYRTATQFAALVIGVTGSTLPDTCPYSTDQWLDESFLP
jgi:hypothetical protein